MQEEKKEEENLGDKDELWIHKWELDTLQTVQSEAFYRMIGRTGINYGDTFRMVKRVSTDHDAAMMRCARLYWLFIHPLPSHPAWSSASAPTMTPP